VPSMTGDISKEAEIDLEATLDPLYRNSKLGNQHAFQIDALSGDLAGVGGHPACSLEQDRHHHRHRHHPNHPYHGYFHTASNAAENPQPSPGSHPIVSAQMPKLELPSSPAKPSDSAGSWTNSPTGHVFSLLDSRLPINPAFSQLTQTERPPPGPPLPTCSLLESMLPINPAFPVPKLEAAYSGPSISAHLPAGEAVAI